MAAARDAGSRAGAARCASATITLATRLTTAIGDGYILNQRIKMQLLTLRSGAFRFAGIRRVLAKKGVA
jgi:hypothetical protein